MGSNKKASIYKIIQGRDFLRDVKKILKSGDKSVLLDIQEIIDELKINPCKKRPKMDIKLKMSDVKTDIKCTLNKFLFDLITHYYFVNNH